MDITKIEAGSLIGLNTSRGLVIGLVLEVVGKGTQKKFGIPDNWIHVVVQATDTHNILPGGPRFQFQFGGYRDGVRVDRFVKKGQDWDAPRCYRFDSDTVTFIS